MKVLIVNGTTMQAIQEVQKVFSDTNVSTNFVR